MVNNTESNQTIRKITTRWDKIVFYASIAGLLIILLIRSQQRTNSSITEGTLQIQKENKQLIEENKYLKNEVNSLKKKLRKYEEAKQEN